MKKNFYKSVSDLWNTYDFSKIIMSGIILGLVLALLDYYDVPSAIVCSLPAKVVWITLGSMVVIVAIWLGANHYFDLLRIATTNPVDVISVVLIAVSVVYVTVRWWLVGFALYTDIAIYCAGAYT